MRWLLVLALIACRGSDDRPAPKPAPTKAVVGPGSASGADPWANPRTPAAVRADKLCPSITGAYFWQIEKDGKTSYILGTRHVGVALAKFPQVVRDKLHSAKLVLLEISPDDKFHSQMKPVSLASALGSADLAHYRELTGLDVDNLPPASALLLMTVLDEDLSTQLEDDVVRDARAAHIPMNGLETAMFQDELLEQLLDVRMLRTTIEQTKTRAELEQDSADDLEEYCAGTDSSPGLDAHVREQMLAGGYTNQELDDIDDKLIFSRNKSWIPELEIVFDRGGAFVAVGADHLIGDRGVIALLTERGYHARRITK